MLITAHCEECDWEYHSNANWIVDRIADIHRGVHGHSVVVVTEKEGDSHF